jgi:hypothetical protein
LIAQQAHQLGFNNPIVGSDSWGSAELIPLCGKDCYGQFFTTHYAAAGATGATRLSSMHIMPSMDIFRMMWLPLPGTPSTLPNKPFGLRNNHR